MASLMNHGKEEPELLNNTKECFGFYNTGVISKKTGLALTGKGESADASGREYVKRALSGERVVDYIAKSRGDKKSLIVMTVPLYDKNEVIAAAFGTFDSGDFMRNRKTEGGYSLLADNSGRILFGMENNRFINAENIQNNFDNEVIQKREGTFRYKINSEDCFVTYLPLGYNGWMMIDVIPGTQIINRLSGYTRLILIFIIEIVLISSGVFIIIGRFIGLKNLKNETNKLKKLSRTDGLTGLYNRHGFVEKVKGIIEKSGNCSIHAMLIIDLDNFKQVNDTDGHMAGDDMLCRVAAIMENAVRESDIIGRLGGDEFVVFS